MKNESSKKRQKKTKLFVSEQERRENSRKLGVVFKKLIAKLESMD